MSRVHSTHTTATGSFVRILLLVLLPFNRNLLHDLNDDAMDLGNYFTIRLMFPSIKIRERRDAISFPIDAARVSSHAPV